MSTTLIITEAQRVLRQSVLCFAEGMEVPPELRETMVQALREYLPLGMDNEQVGWTLQALSGALMALARVAIQTTGPNGADALLSPRLLGVIASAAEGFVAEAELPDWDTGCP